MPVYVSIKSNKIIRKQPNLTKKTIVYLPTASLSTSLGSLRLYHSPKLIDRRFHRIIKPFPISFGLKKNGSDCFCGGESEELCEVEPGLSLPPIRLPFPPESGIFHRPLYTNRPLG